MNLPVKYIFHGLLILSIPIVIFQSFSYPGVKLNNLAQILGMLSAQQDVVVTAYVRIQKIHFKIYPEKRIPRTGNWNTMMNVTLQDCNNDNNIYSYSNIITTSQGTGTIIVSNSEPLNSRDYRFFITGLSHLRRKSNCYTINKIEQMIDLTLEGKELLAGEVSNHHENYINSLDMSVLVKKLYTSDTKSDLNQDSKINSLDYSNQIYNFFKAGD